MISDTLLIDIGIIVLTLLLIAPAPLIAIHILNKKNKRTIRDKEKEKGL